MYDCEFEVNFVEASSFIQFVYGMALAYGIYRDMKWVLWQCTLVIVLLFVVLSAVIGVCEFIFGQCQPDDAYRTIPAAGLFLVATWAGCAYFLDSKIKTANETNAARQQDGNTPLI